MAFFPERKNVNTRFKKVKDTHRTEFYSSENIRELGCHYSVIMGERSNGKTYDAGKHMITEYYTAKCLGELRQSVYLRRWKEDLTTVRCNSIFNSLMCNGYNENDIINITGGDYDSVVYKNKAWYLAKFNPDDGATIPDPDPFCFAVSMADAEHDKGRSYPYVHSIYFDEFIPMNGNGGHLRDEFQIFTNTVSTIIRRKTDFNVYMMANTLNRQDMYFTEMGLYNIRNQQQGSIELYNYGETGLTVAVELCSKSASEKKEEVDKFFAFDSPQLQMITNGNWSLEIYPHLPYKYKSTDVVGKFFISFDDFLLEAEIVQKYNDCFIYIHQKTTPIKNDDKELVYAQEYDPRPNWRRKITKAFSPGEKKILQLIQMEKVYYQDNQIGDVFKNYLEWCKK